MNIKRAPRITRKQFEDAITELRLSVAEVARATEIPRPYLSELRNHDTPLRGEYDAKLRDWLIQNEVFTPEAEDNNGSADGGKVTLSTSTRNFSRRVFEIDDSVPDEVFASAKPFIGDSAMEFMALLRKEAEPGFVSNFSSETEETLQQAFGLLSLIGLTFIQLAMPGVLRVEPPKEKIKTIYDVVYDTFKDRLAAAGLTADEQPQDEPAEHSSDEVPA